MKRIILFFLLTSCIVSSCCRKPSASLSGGMEYAQWFDLQEGKIVVRSPFGAPADTFAVTGAMGSIACMSSSCVGFLSALGCDSVVTAVSGCGYLSDRSVRERAVEIGYDAALNYEALLKLHPDLLVAYAVSAAEPGYVRTLRDLGIPVLTIHEHLESHPLARAEYIKLFGALTGREERADSLFSAIRDRYLDRIRTRSHPVKVLINIPYADEWYVPGGDNYMTRLISDAGGQVLGAVPGQHASSVISVEKAYRLSQEADYWLNPGWCSTKDELRSVHPLFADFPVLEKKVWNNTRQATEGGGNAFWETGPVCPDVILEDLCAIFDGADGERTYFIPVL